MIKQILNDLFWFGMGSITILTVIGIFLKIGVKKAQKPHMKPAVLNNDFKNTKRNITPYAKVVNLADYKPRR